MMRTALAAIAVTGAAALCALTPAAAQAAPAAGCVIDVGQPGDYYYQGVKAGEIEQQFDICVGDANYHHVMAHWQWAGAFQSNPAYANIWVYVGTGSPYLEGSTMWGRASSIEGSKNVEAVSDDGYDLPGQYREWRAGAQLAIGPAALPTWCVQWGSLHNYANGTEVNGPVGGCSSQDWNAPF